jgi:short-subunit dehydrogenase
MRVLITGAVEGVGRALSNHLLFDGHTVIAVDHNGAGLEELKQQWGDQVIPMQIDLSDRVALMAILADLEQSEPLDGAILNAGISATGPFEEIHASAQLKLLRINTEAPMIIASYLIKNNRLTKGGSLTFISSLSHATGYPGASTYCASKDAIAIYARSIRSACAKAGINVLTVFPGPVRTSHAARHAPKGANASKRMAPEELSDKILSAIERKQSILYPGFTAKFTRIAGKLFPNTISRIMRQSVFEKLDDTVFDKSSTP